MDYPKDFDEFWARYGSDDRMEPTAKGSKRKALEAWQKAQTKWAKEEKVTDDIERLFAETVSHGYSILAQNRRTARRTPNKFVAPLPHLSTYLNQFRFEAEVSEGSGELKRQATEDSRLCKCGGKFFGVDAYAKPQCQKCHIAEWTAAIRTSTDEVVQKWRPSNMLQEYPKEEGESWASWSSRVAKKIARNAPASSPLKYQPATERVDDFEWFNTPRRWHR